MTHPFARSLLPFALSLSKGPPATPFVLSLSKDIMGFDKLSPNGVSNHPVHPEPPTRSP